MKEFFFRDLSFRQVHVLRYIFLGNDFIQFGGEVPHTMTSSYSQTSTLGNAFENPRFWLPKTPFTSGRKAKTLKKNPCFQKYLDTCRRELKLAKLLKFVTLLFSARFCNFVTNRLLSLKSLCTSL